MKITSTILLAGLALAASPAAFGQNMFRGDLAHTGVYATRGPRQLKGVKFAFATGGAVVSSPVLAEGALYFGSDDGKLYAIDAATGAEKWHVATEGPVRSSASVVKGRVYFLSYDGVFRAVDALSGEVAWTFATPGERKFQAPGLHGSRPPAQITPDFWDLYQSSPAATERRVYFGSGDGHVYCLDATTGKPVWTFETHDVVHSSPALADGVLYFGSWDSYLYAVDAETGQEKWRFKTGEDPERHNQVGIQSSPAVVDGVVYFGCRDAHLYAVDAQTGQLKWSFDIKPTWINASPAIYRGMAYVPSSIPAAFYGLDLQTGEARLKLDPRVPSFSSPAVADGMAYFGSFNGKLYAVDLDAGKFAWEFQTEASKRDPLGLIKADGTLDFGVIYKSTFYEDAYLAGRQLFSLGGILSSPLVDDGVVFVGSTDGHLYALD
jgi:outer membrane protein assembly factor BamB